MDQCLKRPIRLAVILARVQDVFRSELDNDDLVISMDTNQAGLKAWDSLAHIRLVSGIEASLNIQFSLAEIEKINSVRPVRRYDRGNICGDGRDRVCPTCSEIAVAGTCHGCPRPQKKMRDQIGSLRSIGLPHFDRRNR